MMENIKLTQISKFELHDDCAICSRGSGLGYKKDCEKYHAELRAISTMIYEFLLETIRLDNLEPSDKRILFGELLITTELIVSVNKMMLHRYSLMHDTDKKNLDYIVRLFNHVEFILLLANEKLNEFQIEGKQHWANRGLGIPASIKIDL